MAYRKWFLIQLNKGSPSSWAHHHPRALQGPSEPLLADSVLVDDSMNALTDLHACPTKVDKAGL